MKIFFFVFLVFFSLTNAAEPATQSAVTLRDGQVITGTISKVTACDVTVMTRTTIKRINLADLCDDDRFRFSYDPFAAGLFRASRDVPRAPKVTDAFRLSDLEKAKQKALQEGKPLGFIMVWKNYFDGKPVKPMTNGVFYGTVHFLEAYNDALVLVWVFHEDELGKVPAAVSKGFGGPDEGGWAPNMAVTDPECKELIVEIPVGPIPPGGGKVQDLTSKARQAEFEKRNLVIKAWLAKNPLTPTSASTASVKP